MGSMTEAREALARKANEIADMLTAVEEAQEPHPFGSYVVQESKVLLAGGTPAGRRTLAGIVVPLRIAREIRSLARYLGAATLPQRVEAAGIERGSRVLLLPETIVELTPAGLAEAAERLSRQAAQVQEARERVALATATPATERPA